MISKTDYSVKKPKFDRKIRSEVHLFLLLYINWSITKKFPIKILLEMMDSSVKSLGEVKYDKQNRLQLQKTQVWSKNSK